MCIPPPFFQGSTMGVHLPVTAPRPPWNRSGVPSSTADLHAGHIAAAYRRPPVLRLLAPGTGGRHSQEASTLALNGVHRCRALSRWAPPSIMGVCANVLYAFRE